MDDGSVAKNISAKRLLLLDSSSWLQSGCWSSSHHIHSRKEEERGSASGLPLCSQLPLATECREGKRRRKSVSCSLACAYCRHCSVTAALFSAELDVPENHSHHSVPGSYCQLAKG